uniref:Neur_chan_LBD domain-containing protein n=1 Tax=Steinernema glaseri TaxID=37863 RepID=A0A1I8A0I9_9BILA
MIRSLQRHRNGCGTPRKSQDSSTTVDRFATQGPSRMKSALQICCVYCTLASLCIYDVIPAWRNAIDTGNKVTKLQSYKVESHSRAQLWINGSAVRLLMLRSTITIDQAVTTWMFTNRVDHVADSATTGTKNLVAGRWLFVSLS